MKKYTNKIIYLLFTSLLMLSACDEFKDNPDAIPEPEKKLDGTWVIERVIRNNTDITKLMDFSKFKLHLSEDNTYTVENPIPFVVRKTGTWELDDPIRPFNMILDEEGSTESIVAPFTIPVESGHRQISITFTPGCFSNKYTYVFKRETTN